MALFPKPEEIFGTTAGAPKIAKQSEEWNTLRGVREQVLRELESARNAKQIGKALEAQVKITAAEPVYSVLARHRDQLRYLFIVSAVTLEPKESGQRHRRRSRYGRKGDGKKCDRCWNYSVHVGEDAKYPTVCERCSAVLRELEGGH